MVAVDWTEDNPRHWQPRGKQVRSAFTVPAGMMYTGSSGIWDSVWLECVPAGARIEGIAVVSHLAASTAVFELEVVGAATTTAGLSACVTVVAPGSTGRSHPAAGSSVVAHTCTDIAVRSNGSAPRVTVPMPTAARRWSPDSPFLYEAKVELRQQRAVAAEVTTVTLDAVNTYFGFRSVG